MSKPMTSEDLPNATSSPALGDGATPSDSPDGPILDLFGRVVVPVSPSPAPASKSAGVTIDISGRIGRGSSASVALSRSLASRLRARLPTGGSTLFSMTWSEKVTPAGRHLCRLRASARSISDNGCGSCPTPTVEDLAHRDIERRIKDGRQMGVSEIAQLASWPTPLVNDELGSGYCYGPTKPDGTRARFLKLPGAVTLATWPTPMAGSPGTEDYNELLVSGPMLSGSPAPTAKPGQLNPRFSLWLQGYPTAWASCGERVTRLSRKSRPSSSARIST
jgi:hypothetical protein